MEERQTQAVLTPEEEQKPACCHHWIIEPANGRISSGSCQICGKIGEFNNYIELGNTQGESRTKGRSSANSKKSKNVVTIEPTDDDDIRDQYPIYEESSNDNESEVGVENEDLE